MEKIFDNHGQTYCYSFITVCKQYNYLKIQFLTFKNKLQTKNTDPMYEQIFKCLCLK